MEDKNIISQPSPAPNENYIDVDLAIDSDEKLKELRRKFVSKGYTTGELIVFYQCTYKTWRSWINPHKDKIGKRGGRVYTIPQIKRLVSIVDFPDLEKFEHLL